MNILRSRSLSSRFIALLGTLFVLVFLALTPTTAHASVTDNISGYAWSSNIGWIKMNNCDTPSSCTSIPYGVTMEQTGTTRTVSGYAWSSNIGWISFNAAATAGCPSSVPADPNCQARVEWGATGGTSVKMKGWARACAVFPDGQCGNNGSAVTNGGWNGFIALGDVEPNQNSANAFGVTLNTTTGLMAGFAWGSHVVGWTEFSQVKYTPSTIYVCSDGLDNDSDALIDAADPGCHTDFNAANAASYTPQDPDEFNGVCPAGTFPNNIPGNDPQQPKWCTVCTNLPETQQGNPPTQYSQIPAGYISTDGGNTCIQDPSCQPGQPCWCANGAHPTDPECLAICRPGQPCWCANGAHPSDPQCTSCQPGQPCWCLNPANADDPQCKACVIDPTGPNCPGAAPKCKNIPASAGINVTFPPYRQVGENCLCIAGYVLNSKYQCVRPNYNEF